MGARPLYDARFFHISGQLGRQLASARILALILSHYMSSSKFRVGYHASISPFSPARPIIAGISAAIVMLLSFPKSFLLNVVARCVRCKCGKQHAIFPDRKHRPPRLIMPSAAWSIEMPPDYYDTCLMAIFIADCAPYRHARRRSSRRQSFFAVDAGRGWSKYMPPSYC